MQKLSRKKITKIVAIILIVIFCFIAIGYLWPMFDVVKIEKFAKQFGVFGPLVVIFYIVLSHILAPVAGTPGVLVGAILFGVPKTVFFIYIAGLMSAVANFWISKKLGRKWIKGLAGRKTMQKIDDFVEVFGIKILILSRLFGFALFEVVSYGAGLTTISFKKYFLITIVFSAVPATLFGIAFRNANLQSSSALFVWAGTIIITGTIFAFLIKKFIVKKQNAKNGV